jgi:hypothetical protein
MQGLEIIFNCSPFFVLSLEFVLRLAPARALEIQILPAPFMAMSIHKIKQAVPVHAAHAAAWF